MSQTRRDYVRELNNYLHGYPSGDLTKHLSWETWQEGPEHQVTHHAIANFQQQQIGYGIGVAKGTAKVQAASQALAYVQQAHPY